MLENGTVVLRPAYDEALDTPEQQKLRKAYNLKGDYKRLKANLQEHKTYMRKMQRKLGIEPDETEPEPKNEKGLESLINAVIETIGLMADRLQAFEELLESFDDRLYSLEQGRISNFKRQRGFDPDEVNISLQKAGLTGKWKKRQ